VVHLNSALQFLSTISIIDCGGVPTKPPVEIPESFLNKFEGKKRIVLDILIKEGIWVVVPDDQEDWS